MTRGQNKRPTNRQPTSAPSIEGVTPEGGIPADSPLGRPDLDRVQLDALLQEVIGRVGDVLSTQERLRALLDAVVLIESELDLQLVLQRIVEMACRLAGARYGALGILAEGDADRGERRLSAFVTHGLTEHERALIGPEPHGRGVLGVLIDHPEPLRLHAVGEHPSSYGFPASHPPMSTFLGVPVQVRGRVFGNLYLTEKSTGSDFTQEDEDVVVALAAAAGVAIDNARLYEALARRQRWIEATAEITYALLGEAGSDQSLALVASRARQLPGAQIALIALVRDDAPAGELVVSVADGPGAEHFIGQSLPTMGTSAAQHADGVRDRVFVLDVEREALAMMFPDAEPRLGRGLFVPLVTTNDLLGLLVVAWGEDSPGPSQEELGLVEGFAGQAALALERARSQRDKERLVVLEDRDRIARDLHDVVIQRLFATGMSLQVVADLTGRPEAKERLERSIDDLDQTVRDIRAVIYRLQSREGQPGVRDAVELELAKARDSLGFWPQLRIDGPLDTVIDDHLAHELIAVLREGLSNVARHAHATQVRVEISAVPDVCVRVVDDGVGPKATRVESGLSNLRRRAEHLSGRLDVRPGVDGGTVLEWQVPLEAAP